MKSCSVFYGVWLERGAILLQLFAVESGKGWE